MNGEEISKFSIDFFFYKNGKIKKTGFFIPAERRPS